MVVCVILLSILFTTLRSRTMAHVSQDIIFDIREDLFAHLQKILFSYYDSRPAGKILVRVINYVNSVSNMLSNGIINMILEIVNLVFIVIFMYATNAVLATVIIAGLPVFIAMIVYISLASARLGRCRATRTPTTTPTSLSLSRACASASSLTGRRSISASPRGWRTPVARSG